MCILKVNWDDPIPTNLTLDCENLLNGLLSAQTSRFNRYCFHNNSVAKFKNVSLHGFCDASKNAYIAVIYFLSENIHGEKCCSLVVAKTKVAPIKKVSIPKFELLACIPLDNLIRYVISSMENVLAFNDIYPCSDSGIFLLITESVKFVR